MDIKNAKVIVTGGSGGIGYGIASLLHEKGALVVICGRDKEKLDKAAKELGVTGFQADIAHEDDAKRLISFAIEKMGGLNVLVNNAGIGFYAPLIETSTEDFTRVWETNVKGTFMVTREAAKHFKKQDTGNIINISSSSGLRGSANSSAYVASKFAISGLTECWRAELRPHNVRVMQINPSEVITEFFSKLGAKQAENDTKLKPSEIAHVALAMLEMNDVGFITDASVWATNPR